MCPGNTRNILSLVWFITSFIIYYIWISEKKQHCEGRILSTLSLTLNVECEYTYINIWIHFFSKYNTTIDMTLYIQYNAENVIDFCCWFCIKRLRGTEKYRYLEYRLPNPLVLTYALTLVICLTSAFSWNNWQNTSYNDYVRSTTFFPYEIKPTKFDKNIRWNILW